MKEPKKAFTLAEVLITLAIIGVVAALTIPSIVANSQKTQFVSKLKKEYSALSNAYNLLAQEYGGSITDVPGFSSTTDDGSEDALAMDSFATKLSMAKNCGTSAGCWYTTPLKYVGGGQNSANLELTWTNKYARGTLNDGAMIVINIYGESCANTPNSGAATDKLYQSVCGYINVDINGAAGPNQKGRDFFNFWITKTGIYPMGMYNDGYTCEIDSSANLTSGGCAAKVLTEGDINY